MNKNNKSFKILYSKIKINKSLLILISVLLIISIMGISYYILFYQTSPLENNKNEEIGENEAIDDMISPPGINQAVYLEIKRIHKKEIESLIRQTGNSWKTPPNYHFIAIIDGEEWIGMDITTWDTGYVGWEHHKFVKDELEECTIELKIFEKRKIFFNNFNQEAMSFQINYDFKTGRWHGDDNFKDNDGYGHFNGENYEIWFDVHQLDEDGDDIPYWWEVNRLNTDPKEDDSKLDPDMDGIPTAWEWKWGYDPFIYDNHSTVDPEKDGLSNIEEYTMRKWLANPYHQDIYLEVDFMEKGPRLFSMEHVLWKESQFMLMDKFNKHNITVHIDDGWPSELTNGGGEYLRYIEDYIGKSSGIGSEFYKYHFSDARKGIFRYIFICHSGGWNTPQDYKRWFDVISIPCNFKWFVTTMLPPAITPKLQRLSMAIAVMHELGHSLGLTPLSHGGIDNASQVGRNDLPPLQKIKLKREAIAYWDNYESCMNYNKFGHYLLNYSDGTHGTRDFDDWGSIDLTYFQKASDYPY